MLPRQHRLCLKRDIEKVFRAGRGLRERFLGIKILRTNSNYSRFCFMVSLRVSKKATVRNKIKRQMSEIVRERLAKTKQGFDVVLLALPGLESQNFQNLEELVESLFLRGKLYGTPL